MNENEMPGTVQNERSSAEKQLNQLSQYTQSMSEMLNQVHILRERLEEVLSPRDPESANETGAPPAAPMIEKHAEVILILADINSRLVL